MARKRGGKDKPKGGAKAPPKAGAGKQPVGREDVDEGLEEEGEADEEFEPVEDKQDEEFEPIEEKAEEEFEPVEDKQDEEFEPIEEGPPVEIKTSGMKVRRGEDEGYEPTVEEVLAYATGKTKRPSDIPPPHEPRAPRRAAKGAKGKGGAKADEDPLSDIFDEKGA